MTKFTKEQLIARIEKQIDINATIIERLGDDSAAVSELAVEVATMDIQILDIALAALKAGMEQEPVAWMTTRDGDGTFPRLHLEEAAADCWVNTCNVAPPIAKHALYAAPQLPQPAVPEYLAAVATLESKGYTWHGGHFWKPPLGKAPAYITGEQPVVPEAISTRQAISKMEDCEPCDSINVAYKYGWNACRAAMLQGTEPVQGWIPCSERMPPCFTGVLVAAPWPSAPDGYAMKWATNCPWHPDADENGWLTPGASWKPTHWMPLPAAPQQEADNG